jgi:hypothetical protein
VDDAAAAPRSGSVTLVRGIDTFIRPPERRHRIGSIPTTAEPILEM